MKLNKEYDLTKLNTFGIRAHTKFFAEIGSEEDIAPLFSLKEFKDSPKIFLGGGSNILFTRDWDGIVVLNRLTGIDVISDGAEQTVVRAMGGEKWHDLVEFAVGRGLWGIENLSLVPGSVGAAPMQNIGAYGAELKNVLDSVEAYEIESGIKRIFSSEECELGYRESIFKNRLRGKYFISAISLRLAKHGKPNTAYRILREYLEQHGITPETPKDVSDAVASIRRSKLPDPNVLGNAGSFFKNVFVKKEELEELRKKYPDIPSFEEDEAVKVPAGWLIEQAGWKGKRLGNTGVHERQALVLVNYGGATGAEVLELAHRVISSVREKFGLTLMPEVNIV